MVVLGAIIGGYIAIHYLSDGNAIALNPETIAELHVLGIKNAGENLFTRGTFWH